MTLCKSTRLPLKNTEYFTRKTLDNNDLNQVVASSGFSENKGLGQGVLSQKKTIYFYKQINKSRGLIKPSLSHSYLKIFFTSFGKKNWIVVWNIKSYEIWGDISKRFRLVTALFCLLLHKFKCPCNI